ncbi:MAG: putative metal-binding motif-containing protein, partial [Myxococcota bacterium]|nr:putative metal-binding motif-containing protein [Myxococcota bacterium]
MRIALFTHLLIFTACATKGEDTGPYDYDGDGHVTGVDCDDDNATVHPNATEVCNNIDDDCDGLIDDSDPSVADAGTFYGDSDLDGFGGNILVVESCEQPDGYTDNQQDCNDLDELSYPGAEELCDGADNDCDDVVDEPDAVDAPTWYADADGDGYGTEEDSTIACSTPHGYAAISGDCNDEDPAFHPGAAEVDCTDETDYNCDGSVGFADADSDGHPACEDCDDDNAAVYEGAIETCNGIDDDCDGLTDSDDPDVTGTSTYYGDADGDGYG